jgi:hypothetical protein
MTRNSIVIILMTAALVCAAPVMAEGNDPRQPVLGLGITGELLLHNDGLYIGTGGTTALSLRYGVYDTYVSVFIISDIGWRFDARTMLVRAGGELYLTAGCLGVHVDIFDTIRVNERRAFTTPGLSAGAVTSIPTNPSFTIFVGGTWFNENKPEMAIRLSIVYNFWGPQGVFITPTMSGWLNDSSRLKKADSLKKSPTSM